MRFLVFAIAALLPAASAAAPEFQDMAPRPLTAFSPIPSHCEGITRHHAVRPAERLKPQKLTELPPADAIHAAVRTGPDGCPDPLPVGYQYRQGR